MLSSSLVPSTSSSSSFFSGSNSSPNEQKNDRDNPSNSFAAAVELHAKPAIDCLNKQAEKFLVEMKKLYDDFKKDVIELKDTATFESVRDVSNKHHPICDAYENVVKVLFSPEGERRSKAIDLASSGQSNLSDAIYEYKNKPDGTEFNDKLVRAIDNSISILEQAIAARKQEILLSSIEALSKVQTLVVNSLPRATK